MSQIPDRSTEQFLKFDAMDDEQLRELLREDASKQEGEESDMEETLYIMELLANRRKAIGEQQDAARAFKDFQRYYMLGHEEPEHLESDAEMNAAVAPITAKKQMVPWVRKVIILAACLTLLLGCTLVVNAEQRSLWERIIRWTQETFHLGEAEENGEAWMAEEEYDLPLKDLRELLIQNKVSTELLPTWIPENYTEVETQMIESPEKRVFSARYTSGEKVIVIEVRINYNNSPMQLEQLDTFIESYQIAGLSFYVLQNEEQLQAVCIDGESECWIYGSLSIAEIKQVIYSIEKGRE